MDARAKEALKQLIVEYRHIQVYYNALNKDTVYKSVSISSVINWAHLLLDYDKITKKSKPIESVSIRTFTVMSSLRKYINYLNSHHSEDMSRLKALYQKSMKQTEVKAFNLIYSKLVGDDDPYNLRGLMISLFYTFEKNAGPLYVNMFKQRPGYKGNDEMYMEMLLRYKPELNNKLITMHKEMHNLKDA